MKISNENETYTLGVHFMFSCKYSTYQINRSLAYPTLLGVLWQMCHIWITYGTVRRVFLTISKLCGARKV